MKRKTKIIITVALLLHAIAIPIVIGGVKELLWHTEPTRLPYDTITPTPDEIQNVAVSDDSVLPEVVPTELPSLDTIDYTQDPLLYDFVAGCLDWHVPIHRDEIDSDLYILRNLKAPTIIYTDWYVWQGGFTVPPTGSSVERFELHPRDVDSLDTIISSLPTDYVIRDGDWELVIYAGDAAVTLNSLGLITRDSHKYAEGRVPPFLSDGSGWPTEWLRREPYATRLATESEIDITDPWWDTFHLSGRYDLISNTSEALDFNYYAVCTGVMTFSFCDNQGNTARGMSWDLLRSTCNAMQANINGVYECNSWFPETE